MNQTQPPLIVDDAVLVESVASPGAASATDLAPDGSTAARGYVLPLAAVLFCLASVLGGVMIDHFFLQTPPPAPRVALVEQGAIVLDALLNRPELDPPTARRVVGGTVESVVAKYQRAGYLVVNVNPAQDGEMVVAAVPKSAIDITDEMRTAVALAVSRAAPTGGSTGAPAAAASTTQGTPVEPQLAARPAN